MNKVGSFPDFLQSVWLPDPRSSDGRYIELIADFSFIRPSGEVITVPKGFVSDGSSVPHFLWAIVEPTFGDCLEAAIIHDYLYKTKAKPRATCDQVFLEGMTALGVSPAERRVMWLGVRAGGWSGYGR